jgi:MmyB-like transcription regulator ligand binding domain
MLDVPLADRNALLVAAGYAPVYGARPLGAPDLEPIRQALQFIMRQQEPFPALVLDGMWNIVMRNDGACRIFDLFRPPARDGQTVNVMRSMFHPNGLRPFVVNWEEMAECLMYGIHREVARTGSEAVAALRDELLAYPGVPARWRAPEAPMPMAPMVCMRLRKGDLSLAFFPMVTMLGTARDVMLQQLKIECFFPADPHTEHTARQLALPEPVAV